MNLRLKRLEGRKKALVDHSTRLLDAAEKEEREMTANEQRMFNANQAELDTIGKGISEELAHAAQSAAAAAGPAWDDASMSRPLGSTHSFDPPSRFDAPRPGEVVFQNAATGQMVRALKPTERFCARPADDGEPFFVGRTLHSWLTGRMEDRAPKMEAMQHGGSELQGGYFLEPTLSSMVIDLARSASVCLRAGATTIPMPSNELNLVRVDTDPTGYWRPEGSAVSASIATFGRITLRSKTLACIVPITLELLEDAANAPSVIESCVRSALALKIDAACLAGSGAESEPLGVRNTTGVNTVAVGGIPTAYDKPSAAVGAILTANYDGNISDLAWILHPRDGTTYDSLMSALEGQPQRKSPWVEALRQFYTTSISITEGAGADSYGIVGDFSQMLIGVRNSGVVVRRIPAGTVTDAGGTSYNAVNQLLEHLVIHTRVDVALMRPSWFTLLTGIQSA